MRCTEWFVLCLLILGCDGALVLWLFCLYYMVVCLGFCVAAYVTCFIDLSEFVWFV